MNVSIRFQGQMPQVRFGGGNFAEKQQAVVKRLEGILKVANLRKVDVYADYQNERVIVDAVKGSTQLVVESAFRIVPGMTERKTLAGSSFFTLDGVDISVRVTDGARTAKD